MAEQTTVNASCLCKTSHFSFSLPTASLPIRAYMCHCTTCRHIHGTLCAFHARIPAPSTVQNLASYDSSPGVSRYFCAVCGTHMVDVDRKSNEWFVSTAVVDKSDGLFSFDAHFYVRDTKDGGIADWVSAVDGKDLERWGEDAGSEGLPLGWKEASKEAWQETLIARCHCNGVAFSIARPDHAASARESDQQQPPWWMAKQDRSKWYAITCTCSSCRLSAGCDTVQWVDILASHITLADGSPYQPLFGTLKDYESSPGIHRTFCGRCGASVFYLDEKEPQIVEVAVGLLDAESGARAEDWLEWKTDKVIHQAEGLNKSLVTGLVTGLEEWVQSQVAGRSNVQSHYN